MPDAPEHTNRNTTVGTIPEIPSLTHGSPQERRISYPSLGFAYGITIGSILLATLLRYALTPAVGPFAVPYITYFPAVVLSSWAGGLRTGIMSVFLGALAAAVFFIPRFYSLSPAHPADVVSLVIFIFAGLSIAVIGEAQQNARSRAEQSAHDALYKQETLSTTMHSIGDAVIVTDLQGRITLMNAIAEQLTGWTERDAMGKPCDIVFKITNETTGAIVESPIDKVLKLGTSVGLANHTILTARDGTVHPIDDSGAPIRDRSGNLQGVVLVFRDIAERRKQERTLEESEERHRLAMDAGQVGTWDWDITNNTVAWSDRVYEFHGVEKESFGGRVEDFAALVHPEDRARVQGAIQNALAQGASYQIEFRVQQPKGDIRWLTTRGRVYFDEAGKPARMLGATSDITERKEQENIQTFLLRLDEQILSFTDPEEVLWQTASLLGEHLRVARCSFGIVDNEDETITVHRDYCNGVPSHTGTYPLASFGPGVIAELKAGNTVAIRDTRTDPRSAPYYETAYAPLNLQSILAVPLLKEGAFVAGVSVQMPEPRAWTDEEKRLIERTLERTWLNVENARLYYLAQEELVERRRIEQELRASEARYRSMGDAVPDFIWSFQMDGTGRYVNQRLIEYTGLTLDEADAVPPDVLHHPEDYPKLVEIWRKAAANKEPYEAQFRFRRHDGVYRWFMARAIPILDPERNITQWIGTTTDIHERKEATDALHASEERFRFSLANSDIAVYTMDSDLCYTWVYNGRLSGEQTQIYGKTDADFLEADDAATITEIKRRVLKTGIEERHTVRATYKGQKPGYFDTLFAPLRDSSGNIIGITGTVNDITQSKLASEELARHQAEIEDLNVRLQRSMRETHHRVKNNLQVIAALVSMQQMQYADHIPTSELQRLAQHIKALASIHDILTHQAQTDAELATISVSAVMQKLIPMIQGLVGERKITFDVQDISLPIRQSTTFTVLVNELVSNAVKHGDGEINVLFQVEGETATLQVQDEGDGFASDFDPTHSAHTGLDLIGSLAQMDMRGTVHYENRETGGARVVIEFPVSA